MEANKVALGDFSDWYSENIETYNLYTKRVEELIKTIIVGDEIPIHSISCRVKTLSSCIEKCQRKAYLNPSSDIMDMAGIRIIAYTSSDVKRICTLIENEFIIDKKNSMNKAELLRADRVGYISIHYVAELHKARTKLIEYSRFKGLKCEIQIRTILQHAWAEIEHDRSYKFSGVLPIDIRRRFHLVAGVLEIMDCEFQRLSDEIDKYAREVQEKTQKGDLFDIEINSTSLPEYLQHKFPGLSISQSLNGGDKVIIEELKDFGVTTISQLDYLVTAKMFTFINNLSESEIQETTEDSYLGLLRDIMMLSDVDKYFKKAWKNRWTAMRKEDLTILSKFGVDTKKIMENIRFINDDDIF